MHLEPPEPEIAQNEHFNATFSVVFIKLSKSGFLASGTPPALEAQRWNGGTQRRDCGDWESYLQGAVMGIAYLGRWEEQSRMLNPRTFRRPETVGAQIPQLSSSWTHRVQCARSCQTRRQTRCWYAMAVTPAGINTALECTRCPVQMTEHLGSVGSADHRVCVLR